MGRIATKLDDLRADVVLLEQEIEAHSGLSDKEAKRLDKAVTAMKIGLKIAKKAVMTKRAPLREAA